MLGPLVLPSENAEEAQEAVESGQALSVACMHEVLQAVVVGEGRQPRIHAPAPMPPAACLTAACLS